MFSNNINYCKFNVSGCYGITLPHHKNKKVILNPCKCKVMKYCSINCQSDDWKYHKHVCCVSSEEITKLFYEFADKVSKIESVISYTKEHGCTQVLLHRIEDMYIEYPAAVFKVDRKVLIKYLNNARNLSEEQMRRIEDSANSIYTCTIKGTCLFWLKIY